MTAESLDSFGIERFENELLPDEIDAIYAECEGAIDENEVQVDDIECVPGTQQDDDVDDDDDNEDDEPIDHESDKLILDTDDFLNFDTLPSVPVKFRYIDPKFLAFCNNKSAAYILFSNDRFQKYYLNGTIACENLVFLPTNPEIQTTLDKHVPFQIMSWVNDNFITASEQG